MYSLLILEKALQEWIDAADYYETQQKGLGKRFSASLRKHLKSVQDSPKHFQKTKKEYREANVAPFPFIIVFRIDKKKDEVVVASIFHMKRKPAHKYNKE